MRAAGDGAAAARFSRCAVESNGSAVPRKLTMPIMLAGACGTRVAARGRIISQMSAAGSARFSPATVKLRMSCISKPKHKKASSSLLKKITKKLLKFAARAASKRTPL
jgi:hypothetical protein